MNIKKFPIRGMHCASCEIMIGDELKKIPNVTDVKLSYKKGEAEIHYTGPAPSGATLERAVAAAGYTIGTNSRLPWLSKNKADYIDLARASTILAALYLLGRWLGIFNIDITAAPTGVGVALLVGLVAGLSTCMALIGGLVLGLSARHAELHPEATAIQKFRPHIYFNLGRIGGYTLLGGLIGLLGKAFQLSPGVLGLLAIVVGGVMIFLGLKLVEIFPILKNKNLSLPTGIARFFGIKSEVKEYSHTSAALMGALTFFLPCGFTQAMQLYAVSTGSFGSGAAIMGLFAVGTAPGLLSIGGLSSSFQGRRARIFFMTAGLAVLLLGWNNIISASQLLGNVKTITLSPTTVTTDTGAQIVRMTQGAGGYSPNVLNIKKGQPVKWIITSTARFTCASSIVLPQYGISANLNPGENVFTFTPTETGVVPFSCSMGMYRGKFIVSE